MATPLYAENYLAFLRQSRAFRLKKYGIIITGSAGFDMSGSTGTFKFPTGGITGLSATTITSTSANAFTVGPNGTTNPAFNIDASAASAATGLNIAANAAASGLAVSVLSSGTNESLTFDAKGSGTIGINTVSTTSGLVTIGNSTSKGGLAINGPTTATSGATGNFVPLTLTQNDTTNNPINLQLTNTGTGANLQVTSSAGGRGINITQSGNNYALSFTNTGNQDGINLTQNAVLTGGARLVTIQSSSAQTNGGTAGMLVQLTNASTTVPTFWAINSGSGSAALLTATSANGLTIGQNGTTNPAFNVDTSTASSATGLNIKSAAAAGGIALTAISSGAAENLTIAAKGTTGTVTFNPAITATAGGAVADGIQYGSLSVGIYTGTGAPSFSAMNGSIYTDSNATTTTTRIYVNKSGAGTAGTTWTNLTTAA